MAGSGGSGGALDAELAFVQKKIQEGIDRLRAEMEAHHRQEMAELERRVSEIKEQEASRRLDAARATAENELQKSVAKTEKEKDAEWQRRLEDALQRKEAEVAARVKAEADERYEKLKEELGQRYDRREAELKMQLDRDKKALEDELRRANERDLARDKRDLEETYQARVRKREEEIRQQVSEEFRLKEMDLRRTQEAELRQKEAELRAQMEERLRQRQEEWMASQAKRSEQDLVTARAAQEAEYARKTEAAEARLSAEHRTRLSEEEREIRGRLDKEFQSERQKVEEQVRARLLHRGRFSRLSRLLKEPLFPFPAVVGQDKAKRALLLNLINPHVGGVVLWGPEGNAKFSMVVGFAELTDPVLDKLRPNRAERLAWNDPSRYLVGQIHFGRELGSYLVDTQLDNAVLSLPHIPPKKADAGAEGHHRIPPSLVGNVRAEDEDAFHAVNSFTLHVEVASPATPEERLEVIRRNQEFRKSPANFRQNYKREEDEIRAHLVAAREPLSQITFSPKLLALIARMTLLDRQSARLDVLLEQLARTNAAFEGRGDVEANDVMEAADLALLHRFTQRELAELERGGAPSEAARAHPAH